MGSPPIVVPASKTTSTIITEGVRGIGAERVVWGSDWNRPEMKEYGPYHYRNVYQRWWNLNQIAMADLTEDQRDQVLYKTARTLLKLATIQPRRCVRRGARPESVSHSSPGRHAIAAGCGVFGGLSGV